MPINKVVLEHTHAHLFTFCSWLRLHCDSRVERSREQPSGPQVQKRFPPGLTQNMFPEPGAREDDFFAPVSICQEASKLAIEIVVCTSPVCLFCGTADAAVFPEPGEKAGREQRCVPGAADQESPGVGRAAVSPWSSNRLLYQDGF